MKTCMNGQGPQSNPEDEVIACTDILLFPHWQAQKHSTNMQGGALFTPGIHNLCCRNIHWFSVIYLNKWRMPKKLHTHLWAKIVVMDVLFTAHFYGDRYGSTDTSWKPQYILALAILRSPNRAAVSRTTAAWKTKFFFSFTIHYYPT